MRKLLIKIAVAVLVIAIAVTSFFIYRQAQNPVADTEGTVTVELIDLAGETQTKEWNYEPGDTLLDLLSKHYEVNYQEDQYGAVLLGIDQIQTDFITSYIAIYVNNEYSNYGISSILLEEGAVYSFRETKI